MVLMWVLGAFVLAGFVLAFLWGGERFSTPWGTEPAGSDLAALKRYAWYLCVGLGAGMTSGLIMMGAGGRIAMRLLAATSPEAQGRITEAEEIVGEITVDGTIGFIIFIGLLGGIITGAGYMLIRRWLPQGRLGGLSYGAIMLVVAGTRVEPLRPDNPDFHIVGPAWFALAIFIALGLGHGMLIAALAGRVSRSLPLLSKKPRTILWYLPFLVFIPGFFMLVLVLFGALVALIPRKAPVVTRWAGDPRSLLWGRVALGAVILVMLPGFVGDIGDIARTG